jgi:hypothetical protein
MGGYRIRFPASATFARIGARFYVAMHRLLTLICALALAAVAWPASSAADPEPGPAAWLFDPGAVVEIDFEIPQESMEALEAASQADPGEYQRAGFTLKVGGVPQGAALGDVGIRLKGGFGSFRPFRTGKAAFKVKFNEFVKGQTFFGLKKLTLNNMVQDPSMIHEVLAYDVFRSAGVAAPRTGYAYVRVNGGDYGLYLNVETLDSVALPRWFVSTGHLYEGAYGTDAIPTDVGNFEVDEGDDEDFQDLETLVAAVNDGDGDWSEGMDAVADLEQMARMWAVERYIGHWDGYSGIFDANQPNNYYLHSERNEVANPVFRMLPWGTDLTWDEHLPFGSAVGTMSGEGGLMFNKCLADASCAELYRNGLRQVRSSAAALDLDDRAIEIATPLAPWQELDPRREHSLDEIADAVDAARAFIADRPGELAAWLEETASDPLPPSSPGEVEVAEAGNSRLLRVGASRALGAFVATRLHLFEAGRAMQRVTTGIGGRRVIACIARASRDRAGQLTLRCRLSPAVRRRLARRELELFVRIGFTSTDGDNTSVLRRIVPLR